MDCCALLRGLIVALALAVATTAGAAPFIPASGSQVLETLPRRNDPVQKELATLRAALAANPSDLRVAVTLAQRLVEQWRDGGDPRYLGYAQAALGPWWNLPNPPLAARVMRATLLQSTHHFKEALADLDAVVRNDRDDGQAWLTRATVLQVLGDYPRAKASCEQLERLASPLIAQTCLSSVASLNGQAEKGYRDLVGALKATPDATPDIRMWVQTLLGEMAERRGELAAARSHFEQALATGVPDSYLLAAYSDFLLTQNEPARVAALLKAKVQVDGLLLRLALASKAMQSPDAARYRDMLAQRFDAARLRGDTIHQREQARFALELANDPATAVRVAVQNWQVQKEPADTRLLLQCAAAAGDREAAAPVLAWLKTTGLEDRSLAPLVARLGAK